MSRNSHFLASYVIMLMVFWLGGCSLPNPARVLPPLSVDPVAARAAARIVGTDRASFAQAVIRYPADGDRHHTVSVGDTLLSRIGSVFPPEIDVHDLRLVLWQSSCGTLGIFDDTVLCSLIAEIHLSISGVRLRVPFSVPNQKTGDLVSAHDIGSWLGGKENEIKLRQKLLYFVELAARRFRDSLRTRLAGY